MPTLSEDGAEMREGQFNQLQQFQTSKPARSFISSIKIFEPCLWKK
jgi:hypothetical protein